MKAARSGLLALTRASNVAIALGTGTLANDMVAAQLGRVAAKGVVISSGEFGDRLVSHARAFGLRFSVYGLPWGAAIGKECLSEALAETRAGDWLWMVHSETSSGMLVELDLVKEMCRERGVMLCLDCVSSIGNTSVDLREVFLASGSSGKGLGAVAGLAAVFSSKELHSNGKLPPYLDLGLYLERDSVPFTHSWNLVRALRVALEQANWLDHFAKIRDLTDKLVEGARRLGWRVVGDDQSRCPGIVSIEAGRCGSIELGEMFKRAGVDVSYKSQYLVRRNWVQFGLMGACGEQAVQAALGLLGERRLPGVQGG